MSWDSNGRQRTHDQRRAERDAYKAQRRAQQEMDHLPIDQQQDTRIEPGMSEAEIEARIRRRVEKRHQNQAAFLGHLVSFIGVNAVLWGIWLFSDGDHGNSLPWPAYVTFFWGIGLISHALVVYQNSGMAVARRESVMQREVEMEKARLGLRSDSYDYVDEKPKRIEKAKPAPVEREQRVRLSDDGELVPVDDDASDSGAANRNNRPRSVLRANSDEQDN
ncbi:MAG: 2TM domain-containing protein [Aggregatilineales bacterium]